MVQTLASLRSGMVSSTLNIDYLVQFLRKNTDATVLGEPSITIDDNEMGKLFVGQQVPMPAQHAGILGGFAKHEHHLQGRWR